MGAMNMMRGRKGNAARDLRASEQVHPLPDQTIARLFGSSDASIPGSARAEPNVPQMLDLLNGNRTAAAIGRGSIFFENTKEQSQEEQITHAFLAVYSRRPTDEERAWCKEFIQTSGLFQMTRSLLTTRSFLFIQ